MAIRIPISKIGQLLSHELWHLQNNTNFRISTNIKLIHNRALHVIKSLPRSNFKTEERPQNNKFIDEKSVYIAQNDPDIFGTKPIPTDESEDPGDIEEENYIQNPPRSSQRLRPIDYARMIKDQLRDSKLKEAIDILEIRMSEDRIKPNKYIYNILISACAKAGYSKKAFQLYNKMKQRSLPVNAGIYTSLFNACANTPWLQDGINKANRLREIMLEKGYEPNAKNYNAMIKAYGRCGDIKTAFSLVDEMIEKNMHITTETFNFLLQACASARDFGFRHALITWHKMLKQNLYPDMYSFRLMLRCVRDCSIGDIETTTDVVSQIINESKANIKILNCEPRVAVQAEVSDTSKENSTDSDSVPADKMNQLIEPSQENTTDHELIISNAQITPDATPNLLSRTPHLGSLISIGEISKPEEKLLLLGGFSGFLNEMKKAKVTPGIETLTALLEVIPSTRAAEKQMISIIRKIGLKADIDFFNVLIKKRSMRFDYEGAKEVLLMIKTAKLHPDIVTYGVLSLSCQTQENARELLQEMHEKGIRMNIQILGAMLRQGCAHLNFPYIHEIMQISLEENIKPNEEFLKHLDNFQKRCMQLIENKHYTTKSKTFNYNYKNFKNKLKIWYEEYEIENLKLEDAIKKLRGHPFEQFKESQQKGYEEIKNEKLNKKRKIRKHIKIIKVNNLKDDPDIEKVNLD